MAIPNVLLQRQTPTDFGLDIMQGDDLVITVSYEVDNTPLDFTDCTAEAIFYSTDKTALLTVSGVVTDLEGKITVTLTKAQTAAFSTTGLDTIGPQQFRLGTWDLELSGDGKRKTLERGDTTLWGD